jgi:hypothetical protein
VYSFSSRFFLSAFGLFIIAAGVALACQVPVFRFALERWVPDPYQINVAPGSSGKFSADEQAAIDFLKSQQPPAGTSEVGGVFANLAITVATEPAADFPGAKLSIAYPPKMRGFAVKPIWEGALTLENAKRLVDSPARREIVKRLLHGESAVWVLVESGHAENDQTAAETVTAAATDAKGSLKISDGVMTRQEAESAENFASVNADDILRSEVPLKIDFSTVRLRRDDPAEALFLPMLMGIEDDLGDFVSETMVFPVFGRGRLLEPLIGRGVVAENVMEYATYICGACSCEVKDQNPGVDLLIAADWDTALHGSEVVIEKILPPLEGAGALMAAAKGADKPIHSAESDQTEDQSEPRIGANHGTSGGSYSAFYFTIPMWLIAGVIVAIIAAGTLLILRKRSS